MTGLHTAQRMLQEGLEVVGYDNNRNGELAFYPEVEGKVRVVWGDMVHFGHLLETVEENGVEHIIHLAALRNEVLYKTIPTELFESMQRARTFLGAVQQMRQISLGTTDLKLHVDFDLNDDMLSYVAKINEAFVIYPEFAQNSFVTSFSTLQVNTIRLLSFSSLPFNFIAMW